MTLDFSPLLPWPFIAVLALIAVLLSALGFWRGVRGAAFRTAALAALCLAVANPVFFQEEREPLSTIIGVVVDRSQSQDNAGRREMTDAALATLKQRLAKFPQIEARIVEAADDEDTETPSTKLFTALQAALADVPSGPRRRRGLHHRRPDPRRARYQPAARLRRAGPRPDHRQAGRVRPPHRGGQRPTLRHCRRGTENHLPHRSTTAQHPAVPRK